VKKSAGALTTQGEAMQPIKTKHTNLVLGAPQGWDALAHGPCIGLPVLMTEDPYIYSWWRLTWCERFAALIGRPIRLCIVGGAHPPVSLEVTQN
jgi:hypothetical protein